MKMRDFSILILLSLIILAGCSVDKKPIAYGEAACHYCSMTIVDRQHAAQMVTDKGKIYNFDAAECMLNQLQEEDAPVAELYFVNDYHNPGELIDATTAIFLISEGIPSPMGEFLTAFRTQKDADAAMEKHGGELFDWAEIQREFKK